MLFEHVNFTRESRGRTPWVTSPFGGERESLLVNRKNLRRRIRFYPAATESIEFRISQYLERDYYAIHFFNGFGMDPETIIHRDQAIAEELVGIPGYRFWAGDCTRS